MKEYLTQEKQKELKSFLKGLLTEKQRQAYKNLYGLLNGEFYDLNEHNVRKLYNVINTDIINNYPEVYRQMEIHSKRGQLSEVRKLTMEFIENHYKDEWDFINNFNFTMAKIQLYTFCRENVIPEISIKDLIYSESIDKLVERYDKKNVDAELIKRTTIIKKNIDDWYQGIPHNIFDAAVGAYLSGGRHEYILHNNLVRDH